MLTYAVGTGTPAQVAPGTTTGDITVDNGAVVTIAPILGDRPISIQTNGRVTDAVYGDTTYTQFPTTFPIDVSGTPTITLNGVPDPTITVDYTNTSDPVISDT